MFTIDNEKLEEVTRILNRDTDPEVTEETVKAEICGEWHDDWHQTEIDSMTAAEIAKVLASFY
jgi:hypothetical protein